ncbi:ComEC/Rec2 family competence protein [Candidatus Babeliales bacterium]|nr:ComEC/Rec2 family competence protein [Candidatus Babeliales bacterium]
MFFTILDTLNLLEIVLQLLLLGIFLFHYKNKNYYLCLFATILGIYLEKRFHITHSIAIVSLILFIPIYIKKYSQQLIPVLFLFSTATIVNLKTHKIQILRNLLASQNFDAVATVKKISMINPNKTQMLMKINELQTKTLKNLLNANLLLFLRNDNELKTGDMIKIYNIKLNNNLLNNQLISTPSFLEYLEKENITSSIFVKNLDYKLIKRPKISISRFIEEQRNQIKKDIINKLNQNTAALFLSIFLGNKKEENIKTKNEFYFWGISHYLARSGLHIALLVLSWQIIFQYLFLPIQIRNLLLLLFFIIYSLLSWSSISFYRAFSVALLVYFGRIINKQTNINYILTTICLLIAIINPIQVFFLDFQLSFGITFALLFLARHSKNKQKPKEKHAYEKK